MRKHTLSYENFYPESLTLFFEYGRSPGLRLLNSLPRILFSSDKRCIKSILQSKTKYTVAGTALDFNQIPF